MSSPLAAIQPGRERPFASSAVILNALPDGVVIADSAGVIRQVNPIAAQLLGVDAATLLGCPLAASPCASLLRQDSAQPGLVEVAGRALAVQRRPLLSDDEAGRAVGVMFLLRDHTADLLVKHEQYEHVARALHDVRVPLQAIGGAAEGLLRGWFGALTDEQREFVTLIKENARRQGALFSNLFDIYTLAAGLVELHLAPMHLEGLIHEVAHELAALYQARAIGLTLDIQAEMPPVLADRRLRQVLAILLANACKYTSSDGAVVVRARVQSGATRVDVQDTGVGIRAVDQPHIFRPFFRGESPLKEGRYGGLSLAIARMLVELHGGRLWFESVEGQGSIFSFTVPVQTAI